MKKYCLLLFLATASLLTGFSQPGHDIRIQIDGYDQPELYIAYYMGDKQYIKDTVSRATDGSFTYRGDETLAGGMYLIVMAPDNNFIQILVDENNQRFSLRTNKENPTKGVKIEGSLDNTLFYNYLAFLEQQRPKADTLAKQKEAETNERKKAALEEQLKAINDEVLSYQRKLIANHATTLTAAVIKANLPPDIPEYTGEDADVKRWRWMQQHYFDQLDLTDARMLRTPFLFQRIDHYIQKLTIQHPDTINLALDDVLERLRPADESFRFYLIHFLNFYAQSKYVGMDAVYVHLVDKYYAVGQAPWVDAEQLQKIIDNASTLRPLLIGRIAPDIRMQKRDGSAVSLHEIQSKYTVLYFWRYDCGHCKESTPIMKEFYNNFKDRGVSLFAVCTKTRDEVAGCWTYVDENGVGDWLHAVDPFNRSRYLSIYDMRTTPQIYVLDAEKRIISKRIGAEQLADLMNELLKEKTE
jgi:thiol-disulfide isomerase/thioredoxin